jgi:hypothetical protein
MTDRLKLPDTPVAVAFRHIEPTWRNYIYYVERAVESGDDDMKKFLTAYLALKPKERFVMMPEQICDLCGVIPADLVGAVAREMWTAKRCESIIEASVNHPKMIQAVSFYGQVHGNHASDRELFFRLTGGLPDKKGASIVIHNNPQTANINNPPSAAGANGFRPMDQRVIEMGKLLDEPAEAVPIFQKETARVFTETNKPEA